MQGAVHTTLGQLLEALHPQPENMETLKQQTEMCDASLNNPVALQEHLPTLIALLPLENYIAFIKLFIEAEPIVILTNTTDTPEDFQHQIKNVNSLLTSMQDKLKTATFEQVNQIIRDFTAADIKDPNNKNYVVAIQNTLADCIINQFIQHTNQDTLTLATFMPVCIESYSSDILDRLEQKLAERIQGAADLPNQSRYEALKIYVARIRQERNTSPEALQAAPEKIYTILKTFKDVDNLQVEKNLFNFRALLIGDFQTYLQDEKFNKKFKQKHILAVLDLLFIVQALYSLAATTNKITLSDMNYFKEKLQQIFPLIGRTRSLVFREYFAREIGPLDGRSGLHIPVTLRLNLYIENEADLADVLHSHSSSTTLPSLLKKLPMFVNTSVTYYEFPEEKQAPENLESSSTIVSPEEARKLQTVLVEGFLKQFEDALEDTKEPLTQLPPQFVECIQLLDSGHVFISPAMIMPTLMHKFKANNEYHPLYLTLALAILWTSFKKDCPDNLSIDHIQQYLVNMIVLIEAKIKEHPYLKQYIDISINTGKADQLTLMQYLNNKVLKTVDEATKTRHLQAVQMILSAIVDAYVLHQAYDTLTAREQLDFQMALLEPFNMIGQAVFGANKSHQFRDKIKAAFDQSLPAAFPQNHETILMQLQTAESPDECTRILFDENILDYHLRPLFLRQGNEIYAVEDNIKKLCEFLRFLPTKQWNKLIEAGRGIRVVQTWTDRDKANFLFYLMGIHLATYSTTWATFREPALVLLGNNNLTEEIAYHYIEKIYPINGVLAITQVMSTCFTLLPQSAHQNVFNDILRNHSKKMVIIEHNRDIVAQISAQDFSELITTVSNAQLWFFPQWLCSALWCWLADKNTKQYDELSLQLASPIKEQVALYKGLLEMPANDLEELQSALNGYPCFLPYDGSHTWPSVYFIRPRAQIVQNVLKMPVQPSFTDLYSHYKNLISAIFIEGLLDKQRKEPNTILQKYVSTLLQQININDWNQIDSIFTIADLQDKRELAQYIVNDRPELIENKYTILRNCYHNDVNAFISYCLQPLWNKINPCITQLNLSIFTDKMFGYDNFSRLCCSPERVALFIELCQLDNLSFSNIIIQASQYHTAIVVHIPMWLLKKKMPTYDDFNTVDVEIITKETSHDQHQRQAWQILSTNYFSSRFDDIVVGDNVQSNIAEWNQALTKTRSFNLHRIITVLAEKMERSNEAKAKNCYALGLLHALSHLNLQIRGDQQTMCNVMTSLLRQLQLSDAIQPHFIQLNHNYNQPRTRITWNSPKPLTFRDYLLEKAESTKPQEQQAVLALLIALKQAELTLLDNVFNIDQFKANVTAACNGKMTNGHADLGKGRFEIFWTAIQSTWARASAEIPAFDRIDIGGHK